MIYKLSGRICCMLILLIIGYRIVYGDAISSLHVFLQQQNSVADFTQTVFNHKENTVTTGQMLIAKPNRFRWQYNNDGQLIVCDGKMIYIYDKPLMQVTKRSLKHSLGNSPALLLAGGSNLEENYVLRSEPDSNNVQWVLLLPKKVNDNNGFKSVMMGFNKQTHALAIMNFVDSFDNKSSIKFSNVKTGITIAPQQFEFTIPLGVDVVEQ